jgi:hypothetical protein
VHPKEILQVVITLWWQLVWHGLVEIMESTVESMPLQLVLVGCTTDGLRKERTARALACPKEPILGNWVMRFVAEVVGWSSLLSRTGCTEL